MKRDENLILGVRPTVHNNEKRNDYTFTSRYYREELTADEAIDLMRKKLVVINCNEVPDFRMSIISKDGELVLRCWYLEYNPVAMVNYKTLLIGKRLTKGRKELVKRFIKAYLNGFLVDGDTYTVNNEN